MEPWDIESESRFLVVNSVPIELILKKINSSYLKRKFTPLGLENPDLNEKRITRILERWSKNLPLDPPILSWRNGNWLIEDGIHRINCAIFLGELSVPVIFYRAEYPLWDKKLKK